MEFEERDDRDYLYGRLLALADQAERQAIQRVNSGAFVRNTNAERLMNAFQKRPFTTWTIIAGKIRPYLKRLGNTGEWYQKKIDEVIATFRHVELDGEERSEFEDNSSLNGSYLLGYSVQKMHKEKNNQKGEDEL